MSRVGRQIATMLFASILVSVAGTFTPQAQQAYLPLQGVRVDLDRDRINEFMDLVITFVSEHHFQFDQGDFPKRGRTVINARIKISSQTFFHISNFRSEDAVELTAYSHESEQIWQQPWNDLVSTLSSKFGENHVIAVVPR